MSIMLLLCSKLFDSASADFLSDQTIVVDESSGLIADVRGTVQADLTGGAGSTVDLRHVTVMPGFVDAHVHLFLHPYSETSWLDQLTKESLIERSVRAVNHARATLLAGFTAVRDLGTEGALDADIALRKCISSPMSLTPGPRYFVVTRAIVSTGSYGPKTDLEPSHQEVDGIEGADIADGVDECVKVVRRQIGAGADWIKLYADYRFRSRMGDVSGDIGGANQPLFTRAELQAIIDTAHFLGVKVAAHASMAQSIKVLSELGVDTVEHGYEADLEAFEAMRDNGVVWCPTLGAYYTMDRDGSRGVWPQAQRAFAMALKVKGLKIAIGGDTGVFSHGKNALEMQLMLDLGMPWKDVLRAATSEGWACLRAQGWEGERGEKRIKRLEEAVLASETISKLRDNDVPFGSLKAGYAADIIATVGDLENNAREAIAAENITFVMKGGQVYKKDGKPCVN